jgi:transposase
VAPKIRTVGEVGALLHNLDVFDGGSSAVKADDEPDLKTLHAKIGQLALENDFLSGALTKAGLLSAKK